MTPVCREHPAVEAWYRCDGCGRFLCGECVEVLSRIAVCRPCGELARPLAVERSASGAASGTVAEWRMPPDCNLVLAGGLWLGAVLWVPLHGASILRAVVGAHLVGRFLGGHREELEGLYRVWGE